jgi:hypothetical protein
MLVYLMTIWNILWPFGIIYICPFGIVCGHLLYFSQFGMFGPRKIWQPWDRTNSCRKKRIAQQLLHRQGRFQVVVPAQRAALGGGWGGCFLVGNELLAKERVPETKKRVCKWISPPSRE